jgi:PhzF family phenazine biosynthesis protein
MKKLHFKKIDAFTDGSSGGNPAGYIDLPEGENLSAAEMQQIAAELKGFVNEVGFLSREAGQYRLRYFSSECEVAFCGHATIAIMYDLLLNTPALRDTPEVRIRVNAGELPVYNYLDEMDAVFITAPAPQFLPCLPTADMVAEILGMDLAELAGKHPLRVIDGGLRTLIVPLDRLDTCLDLHPEAEALRLFCERNEVDILHVWTAECAAPGAQYRTRVFAPKFGYLEDPATGSGNAAFGYYLIEQKLWAGDVTVEQGPSRGNPNFVKLKRRGERVLFGGCATTRIDGEYWLHERAG